MLCLGIAALTAELLLLVAAELFRTVSLISMPKNVLENGV